MPKDRGKVCSGVIFVRNSVRKLPYTIKNPRDMTTTMPKSLLNNTSVLANTCPSLHLILSTYSGIDCMFLHQYESLSVFLIQPSTQESLHIHHPHDLHLYVHRTLYPNIYCILITRTTSLGSPLNTSTSLT